MDELKEENAEKSKDIQAIRPPGNRATDMWSKAERGVLSVPMIR